MWQGFDLQNAEVVEANWDIIANEEALNVSQSWHGHPGFLVKNSSQHYTARVEHGFAGTRGENHSLPTYQVKHSLVLPSNYRTLSRSQRRCHTS